MVLEGKIAVVTGGGRGIGAAIARDLAASGAGVVVTARSREQIEALAEELRANGASAWAVACDVTEPAQIQALRERVEQETGGADLLVNNAGIALAARLDRTTLEEWERLFAVNVTGTFLCTQAFLPKMVERGWGRVVNVASIAGRQGAPYISAYCASKHAVVGFTRAVAAEVATTGVTVNAVCPGYVETDMVARSIENIVEKTGLEEAEARAHLARTSPQDRVFEVEEVAHLVLSLCDPAARGISGQAIVLDGGGVQA